MSTKDALRRKVRNSGAYDMVRSGRLAARLVASKNRRLPDFVIIGTHKGGTSSIYRNLCTHPQVFPAMVKEVQHFNQVPMRSDGWYRGHFPSEAAVRAVGGVTGEASPSYCVMPHVAGRMHARLPNAKIIMMLRDPVKRAYSNYQFDQRRGAKPMSFEDWVDNNFRAFGDRTLDAATVDELLFDKNIANLDISLGLIRGVYVTQLRRWREFYPEEQVIVHDSTEYFADTGAFLNQIATKTLGLKAHEFAYQKTRHEKRGYGDMKPETAERLQAFFKPYNEELYEFIGRDLGW